MRLIRITQTECVIAKLTNGSDETLTLRQRKAHTLILRERRAKGVSVVGVPSNDFKQEYPSDAMVKRFCKRNFGVSFPMLRISKVTGAKAIPLFRGLSSPSWSSQPQWNFNKYLVDAKGRPAMYFPSSEEPDSSAMTKAIDALLAERTA